MKRLLWLAAALVFFLAATAAMAQSADPKCAPKAADGPGEGARVFENAHGECYGYWCPIAGEWKPWTYCSLHKYKSISAVSAVFKSLALAADPLSALIATTRSAAIQPLPEDVAPFAALKLAALADLEASKPTGVLPAPIEWVVAEATSADGTRPAYPVVAGVRSTVASGRATSGVECRPSIASFPGATASQIWAAYAPQFSPSSVTLCRRP